jgi:hypothetical protein
MEDEGACLSPIFDVQSSRGSIQSGVALRLPPHSKTAGAATECCRSHGPVSEWYGTRKRLGRQRLRAGNLFPKSE